MMDSMICHIYCFCFFFKQKTAYEMRISDWSSDVCSSDLILHHRIARNYWLHVRLRHYPAFARSIGPAPDIRDQVKLAIQLVWPLARSVYLLNGVDRKSTRLNSSH